MSSSYREGLLTVGVSARLARLDALEPRKISIDGILVRVSWHKALPLPVFVCSCRRECYRLYKVGDVWACRKCHQLDYSSRHKNRTIPGLKSRAVSAPADSGRRETVHADCAAACVAAKVLALVAEIRRLEAGLFRHAREDVADVLQRRHDRGRRRHHLARHQWHVAARCRKELRRHRLLEARRLRELGQKYHGKAMADGEESSSAGIIFIKASERLATLTGMNAPIGHAVQVIHRARR